MNNPPAGNNDNALRKRVHALLEAIDQETTARAASVASVLPQHRISAANFACYLGLRSRDIHRLQLELAVAGLSSLGRCEGHVRDTLMRLIAWLAGERGDAPAAGNSDGLDWAKA